MKSAIASRLRKQWHSIRRRRGRNVSAPKRLAIEKKKWLGDARSPVVLMIDDLTNAWHNTRGATSWEPGGDWGGGLDRAGSVLEFLECELLSRFPEIKTTFFTVAGPLSPYTRDQPFSYAAPLDASDASRRFFARLAADSRFEIAYHGLDHGTPDRRTEDFLQEWRGFDSYETAIARTRQGLDIFARAIGSLPRGGKYGGWDYNAFAEEVVNDSGFLWWCRDWMDRDISGHVSDAYYEPTLFGRDLVVALPSTVHGQYWDRRQINLLLERRQLISVEEHIAPVRPDGLIQTPNIVDDLSELRRLFTFLRNKNVWHANGTEIAAYVTARDRSLIYDVQDDGFSIRYDGRFERPPLTLEIDAACICSIQQPRIVVTTPDGETVPCASAKTPTSKMRFMATVPVLSGRYKVDAVASTSLRYENGDTSSKS